MRFKFNASFALSALIAVVWAVVIFCFSSQTGDESSGLSSQVLTTLCNLFRYSPSEDVLDILTFAIRKAAHMTEFGLLGLLVLNALYRGFGSFKGIYALSFAAASIYAASDEIHQLFISGRSGQFTDWIIDSAGILLWLLAARAVIKMINFNKKCSLTKHIKTKINKKD